MEMEMESQERRSPSSPPPTPTSLSVNQEPYEIQREKGEEEKEEGFQESPMVAQVQLQGDQEPSTLDAGEGDGGQEPAPSDSGEGMRDQEPATDEFGSAAAAAVLTDDLQDQIVRQVEYYFSDENLANDKFLLKFVKRNKKGSVPISVIASFKRMKKLVQDLSLVEAALRTSSQLFVSADGKTVRRVHPLPIDEIKDTEVKDKPIAEVKGTKSHIVMVENLPDEYSNDSLLKIFGTAGKIVSIAIHDPHSTEESAMTKKTETIISNKLHALIEYDTVEAAEKAVVTLNDEKNWRSGLRVELLLKWMGKYGAYGRNRKGHKETSSEKNDNQTSETLSDEKKTKSDCHNDEKAEAEGEEHLVGGKGTRKGRYRSQGRSQQGANGQGHGHIPRGASNGVSKPLPGPRMPDGTRGFTVGRGKPVVPEAIPHDV